MNDSIYGQIKRFRIKKTGGISPRNFCILLIIWFHVLFKTQFVQPLKHNFLFSVIIEMLLCLTASQHWINSGVSHSPAPSHILRFSSVQFSHSVVSSYLQPHGVQHARPPCPSPTPELAQTHVHWVSDAIQPSHPLSSPSPPAFNLSHHQDLCQWLSSSYQVAKVLELQLQHQSFQWTLRTDILQDGLVGSPCSPRDSQEFSPTLHFKSISSSALGLNF